MPNNFMTPKNLRWITVYLFLGLMVLLLVLNFFATPANGSTTKSGTPTANPTQKITSTPSHTIDVASMLGLTKASRIAITGIDPVALSVASQGGTLSLTSQSAVTSLEQQIKAKITSLGLDKQQAAVAIVYGGVKDTPNKIQQGAAVAKEVYLVLRMLGKGQEQGQQQSPFVFCHAKYGPPLTTSDQISSVVVIDIYFLDSSFGSC